MLKDRVSPLQCVTGRQPRLHGSVLSNFLQRLAEHGLIDSDASASHRAALRETARVAMLRLRYSQSIRRAELARSRETTVRTPLNPGDTVLFWRAQKAVKNSRRKLVSYVAGMVLAYSWPWRPTKMRLHLPQLSFHIVVSCRSVAL